MKTKKNIKTVKFVTILLVLFSCLFMAGCSIKPVSWADHKELQQEFNQVELREYYKLYNEQLLEAIKQGKIKNNKSSTDKAMDFAKDAVESFTGFGGSTKTKISKKAHKQASITAKKSVPTTYFGSWILFHIIFIPLIIFIGFIADIVNPVEELKLRTEVAFGSFGGLGLYIGHFFVQNHPGSTLLFLISVFVFYTVLAFYNYISKNPRVGRKLFYGAGTFVLFIAAIILNVIKNQFEIPMVVSGAVWIIFISQIIIHAIDADSKSLVFDSITAAIVIIAAFLPNVGKEFAYVALYQMIILAIFRCFFAKAKSVFVDLICTIAALAVLVISIVTNQFKLPMLISIGAWVVVFVISLIIKIKNARIYAERQAKIAEENRIKEEAEAKRKEEKESKKNKRMQ